jgi:hypothetical protein
VTNIERAKISAIGQVVYVVHTKVLWRKSHNWTMSSKKPKCFCDEKKSTDKAHPLRGCNKQLPVITEISIGTARKSEIFNNLATHCSSECRIKEILLQFSVFLCVHTVCTWV